MALDLNALATAAQQKKEKDRSERLEKLGTEVTGLFVDIISSTFPVDSNGDSDWDKFNWDKAEQLKQLLTDFQAGRAPRRNRDDDRPQQDQTRRQAPAPAAPAVPNDEPDPAAPSTTPTPTRGARVMSGLSSRLRATRTSN